MRTSSPSNLGVRHSIRESEEYTMPRTAVLLMAVMANSPIYSLPSGTVISILFTENSIMGARHQTLPHASSSILLRALPPVSSVSYFIDFLLRMIIITIKTIINYLCPKFNRRYMDYDKT